MLNTGEMTGLIKSVAKGDLSLHNLRPLRDSGLGSDEAEDTLFGYHRQGRVAMPPEHELYKAEEILAVYTGFPEQFPDYDAEHKYTLENAITQARKKSKALIAMSHGTFGLGVFSPAKPMLEFGDVRSSLCKSTSIIRPYHLSFFSAGNLALHHLSELKTKEVVKDEDRLTLISPPLFLEAISEEYLRTAEKLAVFPAIRRALRPMASLEPMVALMKSTGLIKNTRIFVGKKDPYLNPAAIMRFCDQHKIQCTDAEFDGHSPDPQTFSRLIGATS